MNASEDINRDMLPQHCSHASIENNLNYEAFASECLGSLGEVFHLYDVYNVICSRLKSSIDAVLFSCYYLMSLYILYFMCVLLFFYKCPWRQYFRTVPTVTFFKY